jgi:hypothetical protein
MLDALVIFILICVVLVCFASILNTMRLIKHVRKMNELHKLSIEIASGNSRSIKEYIDELKSRVIDFKEVIKEIEDSKI